MDITIKNLEYSLQVSLMINETIDKWRTNYYYFAQIAIEFQIDFFFCKIFAHFFQQNLDLIL